MSIGTKNEWMRYSPIGFRLICDACDGLIAPRDGWQGNKACACGRCAERFRYSGNSAVGGTQRLAWPSVVVSRSASGEVIWKTVCPESFQHCDIVT